MKKPFWKKEKNGSVTTPRGFVAGGIHAGIKKKKKRYMQHKENEMNQKDYVQKKPPVKLKKIVKDKKKKIVYVNNND